MADRTRVTVITNNPLLENLEGLEVCYLPISVLNILEKAKEKVYQGYKLLTHPLNGNWQMNTSPYKTLLLKKIGDDLDTTSVFMLEKGIFWLQSLEVSKCRPDDWPDKVRYDLQLIDRDLFYNVLGKYNISPYSE